MDDVQMDLSMSSHFGFVGHNLSTGVTHVLSRAVTSDTIDHGLQQQIEV